MQKIIKITGIAILSILVLFIVLNPSMKQFQEFTGARKELLRRTNNYLVCSIYEQKIYNGDKPRVYEGVLSNFIEVKKEESVVDIQYRPDSAKAADNNKPSYEKSDIVESQSIYEYKGKLYTQNQIEKAAKYNGVSVDKYVNDIGFKIMR